MNSTIKKLDLENVVFTNTSGKITVEVKKAFPEKFYKYYGLSKRSNQVLEDVSLFFSHAYLVNDLMDGNFMLWNLEEFIERYSKDTKTKVDSESFKQSSIIQFRNEFLKYRGILSLTEGYQNELFWIHYTNEKGYCLELNSSKLKNFFEEKYSSDILLFPINYKKLEILNLNDVAIFEERTNLFKQTVDINLPILYSFSVKDEFWQYENEWRFLLKKNDFKHINNPLDIISEEERKLDQINLNSRNITIPIDVIDKIILAPVFFNNDVFCKKSLESGNEKFWFTKPDKNELYNFFKILLEKYQDKIFQVDKVLNYKDNSVHRVLRYKIEITELSEDFINIRKIEFEN